MKTQSSSPITLQRWTLFTIGGWFLGMILVILFSNLGELAGFGSDEKGSQIFVGFGMATGVGLLQFLALRHRLPMPLRWLTLQGMAFVLSYGAFELFSGKLTISPELGLVIATGTGALLGSFMQYTNLLRAQSPKALLWVAVNPVAWVLAHVLTMNLTLVNQPITEGLPGWLVFVLAILLLLIGGPLLGLISGLAIVPILKEKQEEKPISKE